MAPPAQAANPETRPLAGPPPSAPAQMSLLLVYCLLCLLTFIPFVVVEHPPITDFANHAARLFLACNSRDPVIASMYQYRLGIIPNLAIDLVNAPLCGHASPAAVLKSVTVGSLGIIYASAWVIQIKLFGRANAFILALPAMGFNLVTMMGYINFLAGVAVTCVLIAVAIGRDNKFWTMVLLCNVAGVIIFFCHIFALAIAMVFFFGMNLTGAAPTLRRIVEAAIQTMAMFALPLGLVAFVPAGGPASQIAYIGKVRSLAALFMAQHASMGTIGILLAIPLFVLFRKKLVRLHPFFYLPLAALGTYVLLVPNEFMGAVDIDARSFVALAYFFFVAIEPTGRERQVSVGIASVACTIVALQLWTTYNIWLPFNSQVREFRASLAVLPAGASVLTVGGDGGPKLVAMPMAYTHVTSYATIDRRVFNPLEFTGVGMQPLSVMPRLADMDAAAGSPFSVEATEKLASPTARTVASAHQFDAAFALRWPQRFDYVVYYHQGNDRNFDPQHLNEIHSGSFFSIFKVKRESQRPAAARHFLITGAGGQRRAETSMAESADQPA